MPDHEKRITELEERVAYLLRANPLRCYDCGRLYTKGPDLIIDPDAWAEIAPHDGEGVLCPNCIHDRLVAGGFMDGTVHAVFARGIALAEPTAAGDRAWVEAIREQAREIGGAWGGAW